MLPPIADLLSEKKLDMKESADIPIMQESIAHFLRSSAFRRCRGRSQGSFLPPSPDCLESETRNSPANKRPSAADHASIFTLGPFAKQLSRHQINPVSMTTAQIMRIASEPKL
jgi:hypothetical protein